MSWTLYWVLLAIGIVMTGIFLFLRVKKGGISALYAKAAASLCFISTAFAATSANRDNLQFGLWVAFGLILGMVGDIWLDSNGFRCIMRFRLPSSHPPAAADRPSGGTPGRKHTAGRGGRRLPPGPR